MPIHFPRRLKFLVIRGNKKITWSLVLLAFLVFIFIDGSGFVKIYFEKDFELEFSYPLDVPNFNELVNSYRNGGISHLDYYPINLNYSSINFKENSRVECEKDGSVIVLPILVKSAPNNVDKRAAIRSTWGNAEYLENISNSISISSPLIKCFPNEQRQKRTLQIKLFFLIGESSIDTRNNNHGQRITDFPPKNDQNKIVKDNNENFGQTNQMTTTNSNSHRKRLSNDLDGNRFNALEDEVLEYNDIILANFIDSYENNTYKTMMGLRWAIEKCQNYQFAFLVDDDMYISIKNLIKFIESPKQYPSTSSGVQVQPKEETAQILEECNSQTMGKLYAGKVLLTRPIRNKLPGSKWYLSLDEYPFNYFPPYLPAAAILLSKSALEDFYYASFFTQPFRFDDVYLGILAYKMNITPFDSSYFHVCHSKDGKCLGAATMESPSAVELVDHPMRHVIARHGLSGPKELIALWKEQLSKGGLNV